MAGTWEQTNDWGVVDFNRYIQDIHFTSRADRGDNHTSTAVRAGNTQTSQNSACMAFSSSCGWRFIVQGNGDSNPCTVAQCMNHIGELEQVPAVFKNSLEDHQHDRQGQCKL